MTNDTASTGGNSPGSGRDRKVSVISPGLQQAAEGLHDEATVRATRIKLGARVRDLRTERGLSGRALATLLGVTSGFVSQVESGAASPSVPTLVKLATAFNIDVGDLFGETRPKGRVLRLQDRVQYHYHDLGIAEERLCSDRRLEVVHAYIEPGAKVDSTMPAIPVEMHFIVVLLGAVRWDLGYEAHNLEVGDTISYPGDAMTEFQNQSDEFPAELLIASLPIRD